MKYNRILSMIAATPWAMQPEKLVQMCAIIERAIAGQRFTAEQIEERLAAARIHPNTDKAVANRSGAIGLIPLRGVIANRASMVGDVSAPSGTSAEQIIMNFRNANNSPDIKAVVFDADTPGGSVLGMEEASAEIFNSRGNKPIICQVSGLCCSAGYWIASACDEIVLSPSSQVGNIGVFGVHVDKSAANEAKGRKMTIISSGKYKTEANPYSPLTEEAAAALQADCDTYYAMFVESVARNRDTKASAVRDGYGQGRAVIGKAALEAGLVDRIGTMAETLARWGVNVGSSAAMKAQTDTPRLNVARRELDLIG